MSSVASRWAAGSSGTVGQSIRAMAVSHARSTMSSRLATCRYSVEWSTPRRCASEVRVRVLRPTSRAASAMSLRETRAGLPTRPARRSMRSILPWRRQGFGRKGSHDSGADDVARRARATPADGACRRRG
ncbi:hypothetical protein BC477_01430 [Clavibacter michiganensis subsp. michiganensis]|nr:hypothetical protein BC477_01430 [Clavibacter michiganensis subsp. michiganensis]